MRAWWRGATRDGKSSQALFRPPEELAEELRVASGHRRVSSRERLCAALMLPGTVLPAVVEPVAPIIREWTGESQFLLGSPGEGRGD